jgi:hypothetical protein
VAIVWLPLEQVTRRWGAQRGLNNDQSDAFNHIVRGGESNHEHP